MVVSAHGLAFLVLTIIFIFFILQNQLEPRHERLTALETATGVVFAELMRLYPDHTVTGLTGTYLLTLLDPDYTPVHLLPDFGELTNERCELDVCEAMLTFFLPPEPFSPGEVSGPLRLPGVFEVHATGLYVLTLVRPGTLFSLLPTLGQVIPGQIPTLCEYTMAGGAECSIQIRYETPTNVGCCTPRDSTIFGAWTETVSAAQCVAKNGVPVDHGCSPQACLSGTNPSVRTYILSVTQGALFLTFGTPDSVFLDGPYTGTSELYLTPQGFWFLVAGSPPPIVWSITDENGQTIEGTDENLPFTLVVL